MISIFYDLFLLLSIFFYERFDANVFGMIPFIMQNNQFLSHKCRVDHDVLKFFRHLSPRGKIRYARRS